MLSSDSLPRTRPSDPPPLGELEGHPATSRAGLAQGLLAAGLSGGLLAACFPPLELHWLAWVALVPWLVMLPRLSPAAVWVAGTVTGLVFYRLALGWLFKLHGPMAGATIVILAIWMGLSFRVARLLMARLSNRAMLWAVPLTFVGQEVLRCEGLPQLRFAFAALGYSQSPNLVVAQVASLVGVYGLGLLIVLLNVCLAWAVIRRSLRPAGIVAALMAVSIVASQPPAAPAGPGVPVACVQVGGSTYRGVAELARTALAHPSKPKLVVLPEHTIADMADERHPLVVSLASLAREHEAFICVGAHVRAPASADCPYHNVAMLIGPQGRILDRQPKLVPLPFFSDGEPGSTQSVRPSPYGILGSYVCYDGLFTDIPRRLAGREAEILLVPNMDAKPWPIQERRQHAAMAPFRSIELRRCAVRANSDGVSQIINATGQVIAQRTQGEGPGLLFGSVHAHQTRTPFARGGWLLAPAIGWIYLGLIAVLTPLSWRRVRTRGQAP